MLQQYHTKLKGTLALTDSYQIEDTAKRKRTLQVYMGAQGKYHGGNRPPGNADVAG